MFEKTRYERGREVEAKFVIPAGSKAPPRQQVTATVQIRSNEKGCLDRAADAYYHRGISYEQAGDMAKAQQDFVQAKELEALMEVYWQQP